MLEAKKGEFGAGREFLRPHEVAQMLGISAKGVMRHLRKKRLPGFKLGRAWLIRVQDLKQILAAKEHFMDDDPDDE